MPVEQPRCWSPPTPHGIQPNVITQKGTVHKVGTIVPVLWAGEVRQRRLVVFGVWLCVPSTKRYGKVHFTRDKLVTSETTLITFLVKSLPPS